MTAPGDSVLIFILLALLVACSGYAAGRLHQRWQASLDREEAYRDGYETGTRSVFSTAVRMLGPRRPVRASATVQPAGPDPDPPPAVSSPTVPGPTVPGPTLTGPTVPGPTVTGPTLTGPTVTGPTVTGPTVTGPTVTGPTVTGPTVTGPARSGTTSGPTVPGPAASGPTVPGPATSAPTAFRPVTSSPVAGEPATLESGVPGSGSAGQERRTPLGFPPPAPPPPYAVAEPGAVGGVTYRKFPDPRLGDDSAPILREAPTAPHTRPRLTDRSGLALGTPGRPDSPVLPGNPPSGAATPPPDTATARPHAASDAATPRPHAAPDAATPRPHAAPDAATPRPHAAPDAGVSQQRTAPDTVTSRPLGPPAVAAPRQRRDHHDSGSRPAVGPLAAVPPVIPTEASAVARRKHSHRAPGDDERAPATPTTASSSGRHTVPDELVQAATYRLPPDRVFRAKVKGGGHLPEEPTTKLPVPKPRNS